MNKYVYDSDVAILIDTLRETLMEATLEGISTVLPNYPLEINSISPLPEVMHAEILPL